MRKNGIFLLLGVWMGITGCGPSSGTVPCVPGASRFCCAGIDFGTNGDPLYRRGVCDGCRTGEGYFRKDYTLSRGSPAYRSGWIDGRTRCRPVRTLRKRKSAPETSSRSPSSPERDFRSVSVYPENETRSAPPRGNLDRPEVIDY